MNTTIYFTKGAFYHVKGKNGVTHINNIFVQIR